MRSALVMVLLAVLPACDSDNFADDDFPVRPGLGGRGGSTGGGADAAPADASNLVAGRVCVVNDLRLWRTGCQATGFADLLVTIGTSSAMTTANGSFAIMTPPPTATRIVVSGTGIITSNYPYDPLAATILATAPTTNHWLQVMNDTGFIIATGNGMAIVETRVSGMPAQDITVDSVPGPNPVTYYDDTTATVWDTDATSTNEKALLPDLLIGNADVTANDGTSADTVTIPIADNTLTFDFVNIVP